MRTRTFALDLRSGVPFSVLAEVEDDLSDDDVLGLHVDVLHAADRLPGKLLRRHLRRRRNGEGRGERDCQGESDDLSFPPP